LRARFPNLIAGGDRLADNADRLGLADLCGQPFEGLYVRSARLYAEAFRADPKLANDPNAADRRLNAAFAAAQAGCGHGGDAESLDDRERARFRGQALSWLQAELYSWQKLARSNDKKDRVAAYEAVRVWQRHPALMELRDPAALVKLPEPERRGWRKLWQ